MMRAVTLLIVLLSLPVLGAIEEYPFESDQDEARFKKITYEMRCPKCLNANIAGSDAPIAADLRREVYEQVKEGRTNGEIIEFMSSRYGDFILYRPRLTLATFFLWFTPLFLLIAGFVIVRRMMEASQAATPADGSLSPEEQARLQRLLDQGKDN